jgi:amino acid transporter
MVNLAEEIKDVRRTLPAAIVTTLVVTTLIYVIVANLAITPAELGQSDAFLALIYERKTGSNPALINLISIFAVLNGPLIQIIMASRVPYRLSA